MRIKGLITYTVSGMVILTLFKPITSLLKSLTLQFLAIWNKDKDPANKFWTWLIIYKCIRMMIQ